MIVHPARTDIEPGLHARLAPSSSYRWLNCPASITIPEAITIENRSPGPASLAGTILHHTFERALRGGPLGFSETEIHELVTEGRMMLPAAERILLSALDNVRALARQHQIEELWLEERLRPNIPRTDLWGTCDVLGYSSRLGRALIVDLKTGVWPVAAEENTQGLIYATGAFDFLTARGLPPVREIVFTILQPRLQLFPDSWVIDRQTLTAFRQRLIAGAAATDNYDAAPMPGRWCRFCLAKAHCSLAH